MRKSKRKLKQQSQPWIIQGLATSINRKNSLYKRYMNAKSQNSKLVKHNTFKDYKNRLTLLLRASKTNYYKNFFSTHKNDLTKTWEGIRELCNGKGKNRDSINVISSDGKQLNQPYDIACQFNKFYSIIAENIKKKIIPTPMSYDNYLTNPNQNFFTLDQTSPEEVLKFISELNDKKSTGPNSIPTKVLKIIAPRICVLLSNLINECIRQGNYPDLLKNASISPIHKKDSKWLVENYRPISLLSNINYLFEKIIHKRLYSFFESHNLFFNQQFGFRKKHNTTHALIALTEKIREALDK